MENLVVKEFSGKRWNSYFLFDEIDSNKNG